MSLFLYNLRDILNGTWQQSGSFLIQRSVDDGTTGTESMDRKPDRTE